MSVFHVLEIGRQLHQNTVFIIDFYDRYYIYDKDCYVIYQIFHFDIRGEKNIFITNKIEYLPYLIKKLEEERIDYKVLCKRHGYNVIFENAFLDNRHCKTLKKGKLVYQRTKKLNQIYHKLNYLLKDNPNKLTQVLDQIEEFVYV